MTDFPVQMCRIGTFLLRMSLFEGRMTIIVMFSRKTPLRDPTLTLWSRFFDENPIYAANLAFVVNILTINMVFARLVTF